MPDPGTQATELEEVLAQYLVALDEGRAPKREELFAQYPALEIGLREYFADEDRMQSMVDHRPPSPPPSAGEHESLPVGSLLGPYRLEVVIGRGGMGTVYRALHLELKRSVAIKVLPPELARDPVLVDRFRREARALARLDHGGVVRIHDLGSHGPHHYLVMEEVEGPNLRGLMQEGGLAPARALWIAAAVCDALQYAHAQHLVHRDIKPENILVTTEGIPKLVDFGLARVLRGETELMQLTRTDMLMGTFSYMAPEQQRSADVDHRADLYSVGVVLYEMLTGDLPVGSFSPPSSKASVSPEVDALVMRSLSPAPDERQQSAAELASELRAALGEEAPAAPNGPASMAQPSAPFSPRDLAIVDQAESQELGSEQDIAWLRLQLERSHALTVRGWSRPQLAVHIPKGRPELEFERLQGDPAHGPEAGLQVVISQPQTTLYVPHGLPIEMILAGNSRLEAGGLQGALQVRPGNGKVRVEDHEGELRIERNRDGAIQLEGFRGGELSLESENGPITVTGLLQTAGNGVIRSQAGPIQVGVIEQRCSLAYEAMSLHGPVKADAGEVSESDPNRALGRIGGGAARISLQSNKGAIHVRPQSDLVHELALRNFWQESKGMLIGGLVCIGLGILAETGPIALIGLGLMIYTTYKNAPRTLRLWRGELA